MDNKQDRQLYWEVKDFMQKNHTPIPPKQSSLKDSISSILQEGKPFKVSNFSSSTPLMSPANNILGQHSKMINGNAPSCVAYTKNGISNPFTLKEASQSSGNYIGSETQKTNNDFMSKLAQKRPNEGLQGIDGDQPMKSTISLPTMKGSEPKQNPTTSQNEKAPETAPSDLKSAMEKDQTAKKQSETSSQQTSGGSSPPPGTLDVSSRPISGTVLPPFTKMGNNLNTTSGSEFKYSSGTRIS
jgi:hypothetical protein